jgi:hypothetical protein
MNAPLLLGHTKLESTVQYLSIEVDDALEIAEQSEYKIKITYVTNRSTLGRFALSQTVVQISTTAVS